MTIKPPGAYASAYVDLAPGGGAELPQADQTSAESTYSAQPQASPTHTPTHHKPCLSAAVESPGLVAWWTGSVVGGLQLMGEAVLDALAGIGRLARGSRTGTEPPAPDPHPPH